MSKLEMLHDFYKQCQDIEFDESFAIVSNARSQDEEDFFRMVTDFILQQKQRKAIEEKRF